MLVLVVGPSGAGKDTLLDLARAALADDARVRFVRREITRPASAGGEAHSEISPAEFAARRDSYALSWRAHGLGYGIPGDIADDLAAGRVVVANVSRAIIAEAAAKFPVKVLEITAPPAVLADRLTGRGRETADDIAARLSRQVPLPDGVAVVTVLNDHTPAEGADAVRAAILACLDDTRIMVSLVSAPTEDVRRLIGELDATLAVHYPPSQRHGLALEAIFQPHIRFFVATLDGTAAGCGGVALFDNDAEVKRMYVRDAARGQGVAQAVLARIEATARAAGLDMLRLETGTEQHAAMRLYQRAGFQVCGPFGDYAAMDPQAVATSVFMEKRLA